VLGVNLLGVAHGVRAFTPMMLEAAAADPAYAGHIVNTASMAGLLTPPNMGVYNVSKHGRGVVDRDAVPGPVAGLDQVQAHLLCPYFVPTGIHQSERNRPAGAAPGRPTRSQQIAQAMSERRSPAARSPRRRWRSWCSMPCAAGRFYIYSHPQALGGVQTRLEDVMQGATRATRRAACAAATAASMPGPW
jgi:NAD(P)-dependent dehydrogenase (short-subunit alcohol dehydrogenase family)